MVLSHWQGRGSLPPKCRSLGKYQHPLQTGCNSLGLNLSANAKKRERKTCNPPNLISSIDTLIINLPTRELAGVAIKDG